VGLSIRTLAVTAVLLLAGCYSLTACSGHAHRNWCTASSKGAIQAEWKVVVVDAGISWTSSATCDQDDRSIFVENAPADPGSDIATLTSQFRRSLAMHGWTQRYVRSGSETLDPTSPNLSIGVICFSKPTDGRSIYAQLFAEPSPVFRMADNPSGRLNYC